MLNRVAILLSLIFATSHIVSALPKALPFASARDQYSETVTESSRSLLLPSNRGPIIDLAVPEGQRLFGRDLRPDLQIRPSGYEPKSLRTYLDAFKAPKSRRFTETADIARESSISDEFASNFSSAASSHRLLSAANRRNIKIDPPCHFDADKWALHTQTSLSYAVMFDRKTGGSCADCLDRCMKQQDGAWTCRSIVYDSNWRICDMFAVTGTTAPFTLVEYEGRNYFEYLAANPPSDDELAEASNFADHERAKDTGENCKDANIAKTPIEVVRSKKENQETYEARPIQEQLEADERKEIQKQKEGHKKTSKLQKVIKEQPLTIVSPPVMEVQAVVKIVQESSTILPEAEQATTTEESTETMSSDEGTTNQSDTSIVPTTEAAETVPTVEHVRRKPARNPVVRIAKPQVLVRSRKEKPEGAVNTAGSADKPNTVNLLHKRRKVFKRKPSTLYFTDPSGKLSPDIARMKIEAYQHRKSAKPIKPTKPQRRRIRVHGPRLIDEENPSPLVNLSQEQITKTRHEGSVKSMAVKMARQPSHEWKLKKKTEKQPKFRSITRSRTTKEPAETSTLATSQSNAVPSMTTTATTAAIKMIPGPDNDASKETLRMALRKEIRKFVSNELKQKGFRVHAAKIISADEQVDVPDVTTLPVKSRHITTDDISLELSDSTCEENQRVVMMSFPDSTRKPYTAAVETVKARDQLHCLEQCEGNPDCSSAVFSGFMCEMSTTRARHSIADIRTAPNETYIEKACLDKNLVKGKSTHLIGMANHILAGFVEQVEDAYGIEQCISACYAALKRYGFQCMSAMWYPKDKEQNCLLNSETKKTRPSLFIPEDTGHMMVYFEHPDAVFMRRLRDDLPSEKTKISKPDEHWTAWSTCHGNKEKTRYQKCTEHSDVRKCPKESAPCAVTAHLQQADKQ